MVAFLAVIHKTMCAYHKLFYSILFYSQHKVILFKIKRKHTLYLNSGKGFYVFSRNSNGHDTFFMKRRKKRFVRGFPPNRILADFWRRFCSTCTLHHFLIVFIGAQLDNFCKD
jgi:hypothetical protein